MIKFKSYRINEFIAQLLYVFFHVLLSLRTEGNAFRCMVNKVKLFIYYINLLCIISRMIMEKRAFRKKKRLNCHRHCLKIIAL